MSRNFGISRRGIPRERLIGDQGREVLKAMGAGMMLAAFFTSIVILEIEFPDGLPRPDFSGLHIAIVSSTGQ